MRLQFSIFVPFCPPLSFYVQLTIAKGDMIQMHNLLRGGGQTIPHYFTDIKILHSVIWKHHENLPTPPKQKERYIS